MNIQTNNVYTGEEAFEAMLKGVSLVAKAIRPGYGPGGINAHIEVDDYPYQVVSNDAQTIIQTIESTDILEKRGLSMMKELSDKAHKDSGDGRKTTIILADEILQNGRGNTRLNKELQEHIPILKKELEAITTPIDIKEIGKVATIASESKELGDTIQEIYSKIGKDGRIRIVTGKCS